MSKEGESQIIPTTQSQGSEGIGWPSKRPKLRDTTIKAFFGIGNVSGSSTCATTSVEANHSSSPPSQAGVVIELNQNASNEDNNVGTAEDVVTEMQNKKIQLEKLVRTEDNIDVARKKRKRNVKMVQEWERKRNFNVDWVAKYWFIEPVPNNDEQPTECRCTICTWKTKREKKLQLKLDTIEKHIGKVYEKQTIDGKEISVVRWKSEEECFHVKYAIEYEEHFKRMSVIETDSSGNSIKAGLQEVANDANMAKTVQMSVIFHILSAGCPMRDFLEYSNLLSFLRVPHYPMSHWSINAGWEMANCLAEVERQNVQERVKESKFISLSLDEVTAVDNTTWVCMHVYTIKEYVHRAHLLCVCKMRANTTVENLYLEIKEALNENAGMDDLTIAKKLVCVRADGAAVLQGQRTGLCARLQTSIAPYMLGIHCMAHQKNSAYTIVSDFPTVSKVDEILEAMGCVYPQFWKHFGENPNDEKLFHKKLEDLITQFSKHAHCNGQPIQGILDSNNLEKQCKQFALCMKQQMENFENPFDPGSITRLWKRISQSERLRNSISEYFKLADLCQIMILGSVKDERVFSGLRFLKSKTRNKLDKKLNEKLETCLRLFVSPYNVRDFPYDRSLAIWKSMCERRGLCNTSKAGGPTTDSETSDGSRSESQNKDEDFSDFEWSTESEEELVSSSQLHDLESI